MAVLIQLHEKINDDLNFGDVFIGDIKKEYGEQLENTEYRELVRMTYKTGFVLKKDSGYVYPVLNEKSDN